MGFLRGRRDLLLLQVGGGGGKFEGEGGRVKNVVDVGGNGRRLEIR